MNAKQIMKIFEDTSYVRTGGSPEELRAAEYLKDKCAEIGLTATIEAFDVDMANIGKAQLIVYGKEIVCEGMPNAGCGDIEARSIIYATRILTAFPFAKERSFYWIWPFPITIRTFWTTARWASLNIPAMPTTLTEILTARNSEAMSARVIRSPA